MKTYNISIQGQQTHFIYHNPSFCVLKEFLSFTTFSEKTILNLTALSREQLLCSSIWDDS